MTIRVVPTTPHQRPPREPLFDFLRGHDRIACELVDHGVYGVEAQFFVNEEFSRSVRWPSRDAAVTWATAERAALESAS